MRSLGGGAGAYKKAEIFSLLPKISMVVVTRVRMEAKQKKMENETEKREREIGAAGSCRNGLFGMNESERIFLDLQH
jgi:hypothetical protein